MLTRWVLAAVAALGLSLLTLPAVSSFSVSSLATAGGLEAAPVCDQAAKPAPLQYTLKDMNGADVKLASLKGKVIVLNFWATWCGPCKVEIPGFIELQHKYRSQGLVLLGLSVDDPAEKIREFAQQFNVNYTMLVGLGREDFQEALPPIWGIPATFFIARDGRLCKTHMGFTTKEETEKEIRALL
jgi:peroxiredoxin